MIEGCTALILAGGDSSRMGQDKASLVLNGHTLLERVTATVHPLFPRVVVSVRQPRAEVSLRQICDEETNGGPLAGLVAGLAQVETPWVFVLACDMPFIAPDVVERMALLRDGHDAVVPQVAGYPQPLAAFYAVRTLAVMRAALEAGNKRVRRVLDKLDVRYVEEAELRGTDPQLRSFFDLDTPQDVAQAMRLEESH